MRPRSPHWRVAGRARAGLCIGLLLVVGPLQPLNAQGTHTDRVGSGRQASRGELEALAAAAEQVASSPATSAELKTQKRDEASALRARLRDGDFRVGDRIVLSVRVDSTLTDTFTVSAERTLNLPSQPPIALAGVLRSELKDYLTLHIGRFIREPVVEARPLIRLAVSGEVASPGFYMITPDHLVSDAIMVAGGPTREADLTRTTVRRGTTLLWKGKDLRAAVIDGATLDQLSLRSGDEIIVGETKRRDWMRTASVISGIALSIYGATRIF